MCVRSHVHGRVLRYIARMEPTPPSRRPLFAAAAAALIALAAGVALTQWPHAPAVRKSATFVQPEGGEGAVQRAVRLAAIDSTKKNAWVDEVPGADLKPFSANQRQVFLAFANAERCTCGCGFTLGACRQYDSSCEVSLPRVQRLYDSVAAGLLTQARGVRQRPDGR